MRNNLVTKDAISSQAAHIIEEDGTCLAHRVNVQISKNNSVAVQIGYSQRAC